jgi:hypothetical protein
MITKQKPWRYHYNVSEVTTLVKGIISNFEESLCKRSRCM